jgi:hypothetical protein
MSEEKPIGVIACTESDICVGGYGPLPRDRNAFHEAKPDEKPHLDAIFHAWRALQELGWRDAIYAPRDSSPLLLIEAGSTGVHEGYRDDIGFWIYDGDTDDDVQRLWGRHGNEVPHRLRPQLHRVTGSPPHRLRGRH